MGTSSLAAEATSAPVSAPGPSSQPGRRGGSWIMVNRQGESGRGSVQFTMRPPPLRRSQAGNCCVAPPMRVPSGTSRAHLIRVPRWGHAVT
jgi:hypothetical protein